jgi:hypothetical protein
VWEGVQNTWELQQTPDHEAQCRPYRPEAADCHSLPHSNSREKEIQNINSRESPTHHCLISFTTLSIVSITKLPIVCSTLTSFTIISIISISITKLAIVCTLISFIIRISIISITQLTIVTINIVITTIIP